MELTLPNFSNAFDMQTNASDFAIKEIFMQDGHPTVFKSRKFIDTECHYTVQEKRRQP